MKHTFIIAEAGVNHNGSLDLALELVDAAAGAGADAVKFQSFQAEKIVTAKAPKAEYQEKTTEAPETQLAMLKQLELGQEEHRALIDRCNSRGIRFLSTPFDLDSLEMLVNVYDLPTIKISSGDITNAPLLLEAALSGRPVILSTGMCTLADIEAALGVLAFGYTCSGRKPSPEAFAAAFYSPSGQKMLSEKVVLLHCTTEYPAPFHEVNLLAMDTLRNAFGLPVGYSDHTPGIAVPVAAVARGAVMIEKHFTLDRTLSGPDHQASLEPTELKAMIQAIRQVEQALGNPSKLVTFSELKNRPVARKSLIAAKPIKNGELLSETNIHVKRPGTGISPMQYWDWIGKPANRDYEKDEEICP